MPDLRPGGAERVVVNLANGLVARGHQVDMVLLRPGGELLDELSPRVRVVSLGVERIRHGFVPLVRYLRKVQPDALLANMWPLTVQATLARMVARTRTRVVVAEHTTWSQSELLGRRTVGWQVRTSMRHVFPRADGVVAVSQGAADDLARFAELPRQSIQVIYNPVVGSPQVAPCTDTPPGPSDWWHGTHRRVLAVGTLKPIKAFNTLIDAFAQLRARVDARLLILGEGGEREALDMQIRRLNLQGHVFLQGFVKQTAPYYQHAELHVLSSIGEGLPTVIIEALAAGTPVVSTDCPSGPREILMGGQHGLLVPVGDAMALATAMARSLGTTHDREALKARAQHFSIERAVARYESLLLPFHAEASVTAMHLPRELGTARQGSNTEPDTLPNKPSGDQQRRPVATTRGSASRLGQSLFVCASLATETARQSSFSKRFHNPALFHFVPSIDGREWSEPEADQYVSQDLKALRAGERAKGKQWLNPAAIACALTHRDLLLAEAENRPVILCEDDVLLDRAFISQWTRDSMRDQFAGLDSVVLLHYMSQVPLTTSRPPVGVFGRYRVYRLDESRVSSGACYHAPPEVASKLRAFQAPIRTTADDWHTMQKEGVLPCVYVVHPSPVQIAGMASNIGYGSAWTSNAPWVVWARRLRRFIQRRRCAFHENLLIRR